MKFLNIIFHKLIYPKIIKITGDGVRYQYVDINTKLFLFSFGIEQANIGHKKGQLNLLVLNRKYSVISMKYHTDSSKFPLIRYLYLFGKEINLSSLSKR